MVSSNTEPANTLPLVVVDHLSALRRAVLAVVCAQQNLVEHLIASVIAPLRGRSSS